jgi:hypothetical protein
LNAVVYFITIKDRRNHPAVKFQCRRDLTVNVSAVSLPTFLFVAIGSGFSE